MNFTESFLNERFEKAYKSGLAAKERGDYPAAREHLAQAASFLKELAEAGDPARRAEREATAARIERIVQAMAQNAPTRQPVRRSAPNPNAGQGGGGGAAADVDPGEVPEFVTFYAASDLHGGFDTVVGLDEAKTQIRKYAINPRLFPKSYSYSFLSNMGILLVGPPGTGKTTFAKAVAYEVHQPFAAVNSSTLVNCYIGETGKNVDKLFAFLRGYAERNDCGITIFFDEFDEIAKRRGGEDKVSEAAVPALLRNLDGMMKNDRFLILANTNLPREAFDPGIWERFRQRIEIPLPDKTSRRKLFELKLKEVETEFLAELDFDAAADATQGMSGRDIAFICDDLKYRLSEIKAGIAAEPDLNGYLSSVIAKRADKSNYTF